MIGRHGFPGDLQVFVTVLIPHEEGADPGRLVDQVRMLNVSSFPRAIGLQIDAGDTHYLIGAKLDLQAELIRDWRRPMYDYESGKTVYGEYETDAHNLLVVEDRTSIDYAMVDGVKVRRGDRVLHEQAPVEFNLNFDGTAPLPGRGKVRFWEERLTK
jgi:hypothetical protein